MSSEAVEELDKKAREAIDLYNFRIEVFERILGKDWPKDDIFSLANSNASYHELEDHLKNGCTKELAVRIVWPLN